MNFPTLCMPIKYPDVSRDFPKLIKTIATMKKKEFDYWDDLIMGIYQNSRKSKTGTESYFKKLHWIHLNKPYPTCPEITSDWSFIKDRYVEHVIGTKYRVNKDLLLSGPLKEYAMDENIPSLLSS